MMKEDFKIGNICCKECASSIEKEVSRLKGVKVAMLDWKEKTMAVEYDDSVVKRETIEEKIAEVIKRTEEPV